MTDPLVVPGKLMARAMHEGAAHQGAIMIVLDLMTRECACVTTDDNLAVAAGKMWDKDCGALPVLEGETVVGMLTDRDICMATWSRGLPPASITVMEAMSTKLVSCTTGDSIKQVEAAMRSQQVRRLPVLDPQGRLLGIISLADIVRREAGDGATTTLAGICQRSPSPAALLAQA
jgi:CBS domain-containing protein